MQQLNDAADAQVVAAVIGGDTDAFAVLVCRYRDAYTRFAVRMLGSLEDADDALQSAFVRAYRHLNDCRNPARFRAWLYQIVANECRMMRSRRDRRNRRMLREDDGFERIPGEQPAPDAELRDEIQRALDRLEPEQREAFILKHVEELSYEEIMEITGAGESALKMRVKRARAHLRVLLEGVYHD